MKFLLLFQLRMRASVYSTKLGIFLLRFLTNFYTNLRIDHLYSTNNFTLHAIQITENYDHQTTDALEPLVYVLLAPPNLRLIDHQSDE